MIALRDALAASSGLLKERRLEQRKFLLFWEQF